MDYITKEFFSEYAKRMEEEHIRQNHRIAILEEAVKANAKIAISVEKMVVSMESMQKDLNNQGEKIDEIRSRDGNKWRKVTDYIVTALIGIILGIVVSQLGL